MRFRAAASRDPIRNDRCPLSLNSVGSNRLWPKSRVVRPLAQVRQSRVITGNVIQQQHLLPIETALPVEAAECVRVSVSSISGPARCRCGWHKRPRISTLRKRCGIGSSMSGWGPNRCPKWHAGSATSTTLMTIAITSLFSITAGHRNRRRHLPTDPAGNGSPARRFLFGQGIRHFAARAPSRRDSRIRPLVRRSQLSPSVGHAAAVERHCRICISLRNCPDVRVCQPAGYRSRCSLHSAFVSASTITSHPRRCDRGHLSIATSRCAGSTVHYRCAGQSRLCLH